MKSPIVLLTDYGTQDPYAGVLRGVLATQAPAFPVIDLTHEVGPQNIRQASVYLESSYRYFAKGSIFICVVDPGVGTSRKILCVKTKFYYFLAPDNGLLTDLSGEIPFLEMRSVENKKYFLTSKPSSTFHGRDIFAPAAAKLAKNPKIFKNLGPQVKSIVRLKPEILTIAKNKILGAIVYFDHFGNAISNIKNSMAADSFWEKAQVTAGDQKIGRIQPTYGKLPLALALWNSAHRLEIAVPGGRTDSFLKIGSKIQVTL